MTIMMRHIGLLAAIFAVATCALAQSPGPEDRVLDDRKSTINAQLQQSATQALGDRRGAIVVVEPSSGRIRAAAVERGGDPSEALRRMYQPGSTFKIILTAAALESLPGASDARFAEEVSFSLPDGTRVENYPPGASCGGTLAETLARSCNTSFARLARKLAPALVRQRAIAFGYDTAPPDIPGAATGTFPETLASRPTEYLFAAIGHDAPAARVSALELALISAAIADDGVLMAPRLREGPASPWRRSVKPETARALGRMMLGAVAAGPASTAQIPGVPVAGKTGSVFEITGRERRYINTFSGFAPADDPRLAVGVILEERGNAAEIGGRILREGLRLVCASGQSPRLTPALCAAVTTQAAP
jgi:peptidoglycan glycosyltransferase